MKLVVQTGDPIRGTAGLYAEGGFRLPGDKSLSHRAALFAALAQGESQVENFLDSGVTQVLLTCLRQLGVQWQLYDRTLIVQGGGLDSFSANSEPLFCGNSATTMRLLTGALAASGVAATLDGSAGLRTRPMDRIVMPLIAMGVPIQASDQRKAPLQLSFRDRSKPLQAREFFLSQASAQVKTCLLLAALSADGTSVINEPASSRDHTERMLRSMGVEVYQPNPLSVVIKPPSQPLKPLRIKLPADFSAAAFLIVAALITPGSDVWLTDVGINSGRTGLVEVIQDMGGKLELFYKDNQAGEDIADIHVQFSALRGVKVQGDLVVRMIDEFPIFAVAAAVADGQTVVKDASELRFKESDRIKAIVQQLSHIGISVIETEDGFIINGGQPINGGQVDCDGDHRLAMAMAVAGINSNSQVQINGAEMINESFPHFVDLFNSLGANMAWQL